MLLLSCNQKDSQSSLPVYDEQALQSFVLKARMLTEEHATTAIDSILKVSACDSTVSHQTLSFFEKYFGDPNSPYRNTRRYQKVLELIIQSPYYAESEKTKRHKRLHIAKQNEPGEPANDFVYTTVQGVQKKMYEITTGIRCPVQPYQQLKWVKDDEAVIINDGFDLWLVDPAALSVPVCLTKGVGRKSRIEFEVLAEQTYLPELSVKEPSSFYIRTRNLVNKDWGFYKVDLTANQFPEKCFTGPYVFGLWGGHESVNTFPVKASNANVWLVRRSSATAFPNYFVTRNFKDFKPITNFQPQAEFNWLTTELHEWKSLDGKTVLQGILYKPENFDSSRKYPVIFYYYEKRSEELNMYHVPNPSGARINIPLFVSNGYLVFVPDISYTTGKVGDDIINSVISATNYFSRKKWVNAKRMAIQGHSFGGYETNYLVTQTNIFAAACSFAGISNLSSWYGSGVRGGFPIWHAELSQLRIGATPWVRPDAYISNSPFFSAHKVTTPLLIVNNDKDRVVHVLQGIEFFSALRRLGKRAWMLQYDYGGHEVDGREAEDFHTRLMQFFDHYLKDAPCPA
jgi:dienelactone hydrolase